jgi:hypothetical protein
MTKELIARNTPVFDQFHPAFTAPRSGLSLGSPLRLGSYSTAKAISGFRLRW